MQNWRDTQALLGWIVFQEDTDPFAETEVEVITITEAGRAALAASAICDICGHSQAAHAATEPRRCSEWRCDCPGFCNFEDLD